MSYSYKERDIKRFVEFKPRYVGFDILSRVLASLDDYPYTNVVEYSNIKSPYYKNLFTTDGEHTKIGIPTTSKTGHTKYVITRTPIPPEGYKIVCVANQDGNITCKFQNFLHNRQVSRILFVLMIKEHQQEYMPGGLFPFQEENRYNYKGFKEEIVKLVNNREIDLKEYMALRHDLLQMYLCYCYGLNFHTTETLDLENYGIHSRQTPDFFEVSKDECLVGDITITSDETTGMLTKVGKYDKLIDQIAKKYKVIPFFISLNHYFTNFGIQIDNIPLTRINRDYEFENSLGELAQLFDDLRFTYPEQETEKLGKSYPIPNVPNESTYAYLEENITEMDESEILELFDEDVRRQFADKKFEIEEVKQLLRQLNMDNQDYEYKQKPSHYIPVPPDDAGFKTISGKYSEQDMILSFFSNQWVKDTFFQTITNALTTTLSNYPITRKMFNEGVWVDNQEELKQEYHRTRTANLSFEKFLKMKKYSLPEDSEDKIVYPKMLQLSHKSQNACIELLKESGQDYRKTFAHREYVKKSSCDLATAYTKVEAFLDLLTSKTERDWSENFFDKGGDDIELVNKIKKDYSKMANKDISEIGSTFCYKYLRYNSLLYEQLIHLSNLSMSKKRFALFNSGIPNICGIMRCGYRGMAQQVGKAFMFMGFTKSAEFINSGMFGKLEIESRNDIYFFRTRWFRLPTFRLEFFRDQYYSILSSTLTSLARVRNLPTDISTIRGTFALRTVCGLIANQRAMEKLADSRYAIMSCFATHTNFRDLILEKFAPPYKSFVEGWIVQRILTQLPLFRIAVYNSNNIRVNVPILDYLDKRFQQSTGGTFNIKAVWSDRKLYSLQDLLDELFLYVHTPKEPSTAFHEEVNAIKTIKKFQDEFDKYTFKEQCGLHSNIKQWLLREHSVGFSARFLLSASKYYQNTMNVDLNKVEKNIVNENLGNLTSTKAVVPDITRKVKPMDKQYTRRLNDHVKLYGKLPENVVEYQKEYESKLTDPKHRPTSEMYYGRNKVHDEILSYITNYSEAKVIDNALLYYNTQHARVITDICIKAQYGGKREFYVMNMGAKLMARIVENFYKEIAQKSQTEMISVPGDRKLMFMQGMMDRTIKHALKLGNLVSYCNGDCTKWSASETMEAFHVLTMGLTDGWDSDFKRVLHNIIYAWTKKQIQIPFNIVNKVHPLGENTDYLIKASKNNYEMDSSQNFLQGVFNYMSSVKADVCNKYTCYLWNKYFNNNDQFYVEYLVHSDDYVFSFSSPNQQMIDMFRSFHKMCMKLCGITDSSKKTNVQPVFMEFISLVCFNGSMSYPIIKKTKEVATTLPCESFKGDSDMVCSRTGECIRVGTDFYSAWIFHRIHMNLLRRAYSMHEGGVNFINNRYNLPVECFGESDMHPIFYFLSKGDPNNLRLFNFANQRNILKKLYSVSGVEDTLKNIQSSFRSPTFIYNNYTNRIVKLRASTGLKVEEAMAFWENNPIYNFVKPNDVNDLKMWLRCMYFKSSFIKAYNRDSRTTRLLRLSLFSKGSCVTYKTEDELNEFYNRLSNIEKQQDRQNLIREEMSTIQELSKYWDDIDVPEVDDRDVQIAILMGDSTPDLIYRWLESTTIKVKRVRNIYNTCATYSPYKAKWLDVSQPVNYVLLYALDQEKFFRNYGYDCDLNALEMEIRKLNNALPEVIDTARDPSKNYSLRLNAIQLLYNTYTNNLPSFQVCMSSKRHRQSIVDFLTDSFKYMNNSVFVTEVHSRVVQMDMNPYTLKRNVILGTERTTSILRQLINVITLAYTYLVCRQNLPEESAFNIIRLTQLSIGEEVLTVHDILLNYSYENAKEENLQYHEVMAFVFFRYAICHLNSDIREFFKGKTVYNYSYIKPQKFNKLTHTYEGDMEANIHLENTFAKVHLQENVLQVVVDNMNTTKAELLYLISLKLSSSISESVYNRQLQLKQISKLSQTCIAWKNGFYLTLINNFTRFEFKTAGEEFEGYPVIYDKHLVIVKSFDKTVDYLVSSNFKISELSLMLENRKMFTLNFKKMNYVQLPLTTGYHDLCLYNDLLAYEVLNVRPKDEHNLLNICKQLPIENQISELSHIEQKPFEFNLDDIELVFDPEEFDPTNFDDYRQADDFCEDYDQDNEIIEYMIDQEKLMDEGEFVESQMNPYSKVLQGIQLIDKFNSAQLNTSNIHKLKEKGNVIQSVVRELIGLNSNYAVSPYELLCMTKTINRLKIVSMEHLWLKTLSNMLENWLSKAVKLSVERENIMQYTVMFHEGDIKVYRRRKMNALLIRDKIKTTTKSFIDENIDEVDDDEDLIVYTKVELEEFLKDEACFGTPIPFYTKRDDFQSFLKRVMVTGQDVDI